MCPNLVYQGQSSQLRDVKYGQAPGYCNPLFPWTCKDIEFGGAAIDKSRDRVRVDSLINNNQALNRFTTNNGAFPNGIGR